MPQLISPGPRSRLPIEDLRALQIGPHAFLPARAAQYGIKNLRFHGDC